MITIKADDRFSKSRQLIKEWPDRAFNIGAYLTFLSAKYLREEIKSLVPKGAVWKSYLKAITISNVTSTPGQIPVHAVYVRSKKQKTKRDASRPEVVYVRARAMGRTSEAVKVLVSHNPWTWGTLPFLPKKREALLVVRRVRSKEVARIDKRRSAEKPKWQSELKKAGVRPQRSFHHKGGAQMVRDVAFLALRLEFGMAGTPSKAHWRPALRRWKSEFRKLTHRPDVQAAFLDPKFSSWRAWPPRTKKAFSFHDAKNLIEFQKRLGVMKR